MSTEDNKALIRRFYEEVFNKRNLAALDDFYAPDHADHTLPPGLPVGPEGTRQAIAIMLAGFPDLYITIEDMIAEGGKVVTRFTTHGTQQGTLGSIPPTGKQVAVSTIEITRIAPAKGEIDESDALVMDHFAGGVRRTGNSDAVPLLPP